MMLEAIFIVLGLTMFIEALFEKWNLWDDFARLGSRSDFEFVMKLTSCRFCMMFWLSVLVTFFYWITHEFFWGLFIVPFVVSGFNQLRR